MRFKREEPSESAAAIDGISRISHHLPALPYRYGTSQLDAHTAARQYIPRQRVIRYLIEPSSTPLCVGAQRQQHIAGDDRNVVVKQIVYRSESQIYRGGSAAVAGLTAGQSYRAVL